MMNAGRELDALVAEKVMGFPIKDYRSTARHPFYSWAGEYVGISYAPNDEPYIVIDDEGKAGCPHVRRIPDYSADIAAAWEVLGVIMTKPFSVRKRFFDALKDMAVVEGVSAEGLWALQLLHTRFAECVCLAALKAVGVGVLE